MQFKHKHGHQQHKSPLLLQGSFPGSGSVTTTSKHYSKRHTPVSLAAVDTMTMTNAVANHDVTEKLQPFCPQVSAPVSLRRAFKSADCAR